MKVCTICNEYKSIDEFSKRSRNSDGTSSWCIPCKRNYDNSYYKNNKSRREYIRNNQDKREKETEKYIIEYLLANPCVDCGEKDPVVLEFDHISGIKRKEIAILKRYSLKAVREEIEKCEVRCANCHRRKTAEQLGWKNKFAFLA